MKVFHVVHWARSGIGVLLRDLIENRSQQVEHVVMCLAPGKPVTDQIRAAGAEVYEPTRPIGWGTSVKMLRKWTRLHRADVIHSHSLSPRTIAAFSMTGLPHMTTVHAAYLYFQERGTRSAIKRALECIAARRLTGPCVCVSEDVVRSLPCEAMTSRAVVILNGINLRRTRVAANEDLNLEGDPLLVAVGRLDWEKGFDRLITAIGEARSRFPHIRLVICGDGVQRESLESQTRSLGLSDVVLFTGHVASASPYFRLADAFISSSVQEGFALTAVEAMALARPVIATPAAGVGSILRDGETAILAEGFQSQDIVQAIVRAFADRDRLQRIADAGRSFAEENLDVRRAVSAYERIYRDIALYQR